MAVDLGDLIEDLKTEVSPPGINSFPDSIDDEWFSQLRNAFWEIKLDGMLDEYTEEDGVVVHRNGGPDIPRDLQQLVIFYAGFRIVRAYLIKTLTVFKTKAGPVEYETQQSATVLRDLLAELQRKRNLILERLSDLGMVTDTYIDAMYARDVSFLNFDNRTWVR